MRFKLGIFTPKAKVKKMKLEWELISDAPSPTGKILQGPESYSIYRAPIANGWLVSNGNNICFVTDAPHEWGIEHETLKDTVCYRNRCTHVYE